MNTPGAANSEVPPPHRILIVDDHPELRVMLRTRLQFELDMEVVGEGSNGAEGVRLTRALTPSAVVLDLEMPVMRGDEAIPLMRALAPGMGIMLYTGAQEFTLSAEATPDLIVQKGTPLAEVVLQLRTLLGKTRLDLLQIELGKLPLAHAIAAFDTWTEFVMQIQVALERGDELRSDQLGGRTVQELEALMGIYASIGHYLQKAAHSGSGDVSPVIYTSRDTATAAYAAMLALHDLHGFRSAWGYEVPPDAMSTLDLMRGRLLKALKSGVGAAPTKGQRPA